MKFRVTQECDYVQGHLRYGHYEGIIDVEDENELKKKIRSGYITDYLSLVIDDFSCENAEVGANPIEYEVIED